MKTRLSRIIKWQLLSMSFFMTGNVLAQDTIHEKNREDSLDRYGAIGLRPGIFSNLANNNEFTMPLLGIFIDYSFGKFRHSIELDFLTKKPRKLFKNSYSPCFTYNLSYKTATWKKMDIHPGFFLNCRKDVLTRKQYYFPNDTTISYATSGYHTIFSFGPSLELSGKVFFPGKRSFLTVGARIMYSFDVLAYGITFNAANSKYVDPWERIEPAERFQRDAFVASLKIGWGKLAGEKSETVDFEVDVIK